MTGQPLVRAEASEGSALGEISALHLQRINVKIPHISRAGDYAEPVS